MFKAIIVLFAVLALVAAASAQYYGYGTGYSAYGYPSYGGYGHTGYGLGYGGYGSYYGGYYGK